MPRAYVVEHKSAKANLHVFAPSEVAARKVRAELMELHGLKRAELEVNFVDIPSNKEDLIEFMNHMVREVQP